MDRALLVKILLLAAVVCLAVAWFLSAGWFFDSGNTSAWGFAGLTALAGAFLAERL